MTTDAMGVAAIIGSFGVVITAVGGLVIGIRTTRKVNDVQQTMARVSSDIRTVNGRSLGTLAELEEGRRIRREILPEDRTEREQAYVDLLKKVEVEGSSHEVAEDLQLAEQLEVAEDLQLAQRLAQRLAKRRKPTGS